MPFDFKLPDLGEGIREAEILGVRISEGQTIAEDAPLFEVETDKAVVEIPSPVAGQIKKIYVKVGEIVNVGSVMVSIDNGTGKEEVKTIADIKENTKSGNFTEQRATSNLPSTAHEIIATPATRQLARELKIDIHLVKGSGPGGKISKEDLLAYADTQKAENVPAQEESPAKPKATNETEYQLPDFAKYGPIERVAIRSVRRKTAQMMSLSWSKIPHVTHCDEVDITELEKLRGKHEAQMKGKHLTLTPYFLKAVTIALEKYPQFNASLDEKNEEIILKHYYNIGMAVATERGLIVPVIKNVDKRNIEQLAIEVNNVAEKTRSGKIELDELQGGTFTITNIGSIGGTSATPIISYPESAILAIMQAKEKPVVRKGQIVISSIMPLCLAFDHRIADGAEAARFVQLIVKNLEETSLLSKNYDSK